jgi:2-pyrone-4,6-dicarboxylate lactonase
MGKPTTGDFTQTAGWMDGDTDPSRPTFKWLAGAVDAHGHVLGLAQQFTCAPERKNTPCDTSKHPKAIRWH